MADPADILDSIAMLQSMYPQDNELVLSSETARYVEKPTSTPPGHLELTLTVTLDRFPDHELEVQCVVVTESGIVRMTPRHPDWLDRRSYTTLQSSLEEHTISTPISEYILDAIELVRSSADELLWSKYAAELEAEGNPDDEEENGPDRLERVWFWFPMLSTREKRKDLVEYAPRYGLTGFVLAGEHENVRTGGRTPDRRQTRAAVPRGRWRRRGAVHVGHQVHLVVGHPAIPEKGQLALHCK